MKNERLLDAFGQIDEEWIDEADPEKDGNCMKKRRNYSWMKWVGAAACLVIMAGAAAPMLFPEKVQQLAKDESEPMETIETELEEEMPEDLSSNENDTTSEVTATQEPQAQAEEEIPILENTDNTWGLNLSAKDVTPAGLTLVITQSGGEPAGELNYGSDYHLTVLKDGVWTDVPYVVDGDVAWTSEAYMVRMEDSTELEISWEWLYGSLAPGTYRISKGFVDFRGTGDYDNQSLYAEFTIEE